jgi:hypothetical protein
MATSNTKTGGVEKKIAAKVEEIKTDAKTVAKEVEAKAEEVKETIVKEVAPAKVEETAAAPVVEQKPEKKRPGRKPGSKNKTTKEDKIAKKEADTEVFIQFGAGEASVQAAIEKIRAEYVAQGHRASAIKSLRVYLKPEENAAYYVINEKAPGKVDLF